mgnify:FL=1
MKVMIIDSDEAHVRQLQKRLSAMGYDAVSFSHREEALASLSESPVDLILFDPAPLAMPKQIVAALKNANLKSCYVAVMSTNEDIESVYLESGAHFFLSKPVGESALEGVVLNATNLGSLRQKLSDTKKDFPSGGGILAKSAYNELFISSIDRAERRGEKAYTLFISISNFKSISAELGAYKANEISAQLAHELSTIRRQSDILSQTDVAEYAILFFGVEDSTEPKEATARFVAQLSDPASLFGDSEIPVDLAFDLIELPTGLCCISETSVSN